MTPQTPKYIFEPNEYTWNLKYFNSDDSLGEYSSYDEILEAYHNFKLEDTTSQFNYDNVYFIDNYRMEN